MARQQSSVSTRGIGLELQRLRKDRGLTCAAVGEKLGTSGSMISRIETGRREAASEEVASILTILGVVGVERERLIDLARRQGDSGLVESATSTEQSRSFINFESRAVRITDFELMLVPGLAQTPEYAHAVITALQVDEGDTDIEARVARRISRQAMLTRKQPPELRWILTEEGLRRPIGGGRVMARQVRRLAELAESPNITINIVAAAVAEHAGLLGQFVILDFATEPTIVYVEDRTTGLFLDDPDKVALYKLSVEKLADAAMDEGRSLDLLRAIAIDLERE